MPSKGLSLNELPGRMLKYFRKVGTLMQNEIVQISSGRVILLCIVCPNGVEDAVDMPPEKLIKYS